jgi:pimeloyl-ACP methyl ester carboxylesterase/2-polyprenyl-6-methoxyphenol hydroxylase-like FAD-dependent oxidoreductase
VRSTAPAHDQTPAHATQHELVRSSSGVSAGGRRTLRDNCYEEEAHVRRIGEHAVVIGGSMAGLLAAGSLAEAYERVTVIERDTLPAGLGGRRAVPQGLHPHALLPRGQDCLDALLPGFSAELVAAGAPTCAALAEMRFVIGGHELARASTGASSTLASRPFIEGHVRRRIRELPSIKMIDGRDALGLTTGRHGGQRITGVRVLRRADGSAEETLAADLVVAATGRAGRVPAWLEALGYESPAVERLKVGVTYASRPLSLPADPLDGDKFVLIGARPGHPRTLFLFAQEDGRWILGLGGYGPDHRPPSDPEGFAAFAATVAPPDVLEAIEAAEPLDEIATHGFSASLRRRYDRLRGFPAGLLVAGDAICSFNPTYGQGMTVAAAQAVALRNCLERGERDLARRFFRAASVPVDHAWELSVGADLALPEVAGTQSARVRLVNAYLRRLRARAEQDPAVAAALIAVVGMIERPPHVLRPAIAARVARGPRPVAWSDRVEGVRRRDLCIGGVRTPLREAGPAETSEAVVFLHGSPGSSADWEPLLAAVGRRWRAVAWDAPGFGQATSQVEVRQTVSAHTEFVGRALDALGIERAHLVAHDFGGPWGLAWASSEPHRFASAILLGTGALPGYRWHALARLWRTPHIGELFMAAATRLGFRLLLRRGNPRGLPRAFVDRMYDDFDSETRNAVLDLYRSVSDVAGDGERLAEALRPLDRPALVLWGRHDPYMPVTDAERQRAAFPRAEIRVLERSGHWPFVDDQATVTAAVTGFLTRHVGARTRPRPEPLALGADLIQPAL